MKYVIHLELHNYKCFVINTAFFSGGINKAKTGIVTEFNKFKGKQSLSLSISLSLSVCFSFSVNICRYSEIILVVSDTVKKITSESTWKNIGCKCNVQCLVHEHIFRSIDCICLEVVGPITH